MDRWVDIVADVVTGLISTVASIVAVLAGIVVGLFVATLFSIVAGSPQARGLTIYSSATWCPYIEPSASDLEKFFWLGCVICGWTAAHWLIGWIFVPSDMRQEILENEKLL